MIRSKLTTAQRSAVDKADGDGFFRANPRTIRSLSMAGVAFFRIPLDPHVAQLAQRELPFVGAK